MGILNRDYMKRPPEDDPGASSSESKAEEFVTRFLRRHPRFFVYVGVGLAVLVVAAIIVAKVAAGSH
jgi:hypothetical protein